MARSKANKNKGVKVVAGAIASNLAYNIGDAAGRALRPMLPLMVLGLLFAGSTYLLWLPLREDPRVQLDREGVLGSNVFAQRQSHPWISNPEWQRIKQLGLVAEGRSVFEPDLAKELAEAYKGSPWIKEVGQVRLCYPASLKVTDVVLRKPFAAVKYRNRPLYIDKEGFVLPSSAELIKAELPWVAGMTVPSTSVGRQIDQLQVIEGLGLLACIDESLRRAQIECKASAVHLEGALWRVALKSGPVLEWGYWDENLRPEGEPSTREKKAALIQRLRECDPARLKVIRLDMPGAPVEFKE